MGVYFFKQMILTKTNNNYTHELFGSLTTIINENNEVFFISSEIAKILDQENKNLLRRLDTDEIIKLNYEDSKLILKQDNIHSSGIILLTESGLYKTISNTRKLSVIEKNEFINWCKTFNLGIFDFIKLYSPQETEFFYQLKQALNPFYLELKLQYFCDKYKIDAYIESYNIAIEFDENNHNNYDKNKEIIRENFIKEKLKCRFIRVSNFNTNSYNIGLVIKQIFNI